MSEQADVLGDADQEQRGVRDLCEVSGLHYFLERDERHIKYPKILLLENLIDLDKPRLVVLVVLDHQSPQNRKHSFDLRE